MSVGWERKRIADLCEVSAGQSPEGRFYNSDGNGMPFYQGKKDFGERFLEAPVKWTTQITKIARAGDILMSVRAPVGPVNFAADDVCIGRGLAAIRSNPGIDREFLFYQLLHLQPKIAGKEGAVFSSINKAEIESLPIMLAPLPEQRRIVAILDEAFDGIATAKASAEKNLQNARALFEGHLQSVFTQCGEGWIKSPIGSICDIKHGFAFDGAEFSASIPDGNPLVITPGNFTEDGRLLFNERNSKRFNGDPPSGFLFDVGDLVIVMTDLSSKMKILGKPAFVETNDVLHNQRIGRVVFKSERIEKRFLYYFMMSEGFLDSIKKSSTGTMVRHTAPTRILGNVIPFPQERGEQLRVVSKLDSLRGESQRLQSIYEQRIVALEALKRSLLHQAFSGHL
jgi:type I restriction enzyme S subunit